MVTTLVVSLVVGSLAVIVLGVVVAAVVAAQLRRLAADQAGTGDRQLHQHREELRHELDRVTTLLVGLQERQATQHGEVATRLSEATRTTAELADTTRHLREALASPKARGQWGERMADDVLRLAGFREGVNYRKQTALASGSIPDVTFLLPGELVLHMDVKFPVDNYLRSLEASTPAEVAGAEAAFLRDVRQRIRELAGRGYVEPGVTVDHVLLFIPNESVYGFMHERDPALADLALRQKVVLCSPFTLFAVLSVIRQAVDATHLERASDEVLQCLGAFADQWERFSASLDQVGRRLETAQKGFEELAGPRRRQLERQLDELDTLRAHRGIEPVVEGERAPPPVQMRAG